MLSIFCHRLGLGLNTVDGYIAECVDYIWYSHWNIKCCFCLADFRCSNLLVTIANYSLSVNK